MYADIEDLVLSGKLFNGDSRSSSPARAPSPDAGWYHDELSDGGDDSANSNAPPGDAAPSIGMGPGRTGVKGVIRDRDEALSLNRSKRAREVAELNRRMEKTSLGGKTFLEEEREREWEKAVLEGREPGKRVDVFGNRKEGKFGHLREVGLDGFVSAVEQEDMGIWVVVHLYEYSLDRCYYLDETLARLARIYPDTKFLRARAASLGFASTQSSSARKSRASSSRSFVTRNRLTDDDDPYADDDDTTFEEQHTQDGDETEVEVDTDVLPTLLVYRNGQLVHNWVRVDWEAGDAGVEDLLERHHILSHTVISNRNCGLSSDDEDFIWSDDEKLPL